MNAQQQNSLTQHIILTLFAISLCLLLPSKTTHAADSANFDALIQRAEQRRVAIANTLEASTFFIFVESDDSIAFGTGFSVADGYILTNGHVTDGAHTYYVAGRDFTIMEATLVKEVDDGYNDFALLKFSPPVQLPILPFNLGARRTDRVSAWGYPNLVLRHDIKLHYLLEEGEFAGLPPVVYTEGIVSSFVDDGSMQSIVHSAAIAGGNSGGPLVNAHGHVVGVNTWGSTDDDEGAFVNAAQPASAAIAFLRSCGVEPRIIEGTESVAENTYSPPASNNTPLEPRQNPTQEPSFSLPSIATTSPNSNPLGNLGNITASVAQALGGAISGYQFNDNDFHKNNDFTGESKDIFNAALNGDAAAQAYIGHAYYNGDGVTMNSQKGLYWLEKATANGDNDAKALLGTIYIIDNEFKDTQLGLKLMHEAVKKDDYYASILAEFLYLGEAYGIQMDAEAALEILKSSVQSGDPDAEALMAHILFEESFDDETSVQRALKLAQKAATKDIARAYTVLSGMAYYGIGLPENETQASQYAQKAADGGDTEGMALLGFYYANGAGVKQNPKKAFEYSEKAAEYASFVGATTLAELYANGNGVKKNLALAWAYSNIAARYEYKYAVDLRDELQKITTPAQREEGNAYVQSWYAQWGLNTN